MAYILHQSPAGHGHGTVGYEQLESSGGCQPSRAPLPGSTSVRAAFVHVVGDLLQSVGVLVAATIIYFKVPRLESTCTACRSNSPSPMQGALGTPPPGAQLSSAPQPNTDPALQPQCKIADPISTLFFSVFVLGSTFTILRDVFRVLMEGGGCGWRPRVAPSDQVVLAGTPRGTEFDAVKEVLLEASGVQSAHDLHLWALTPSHPAVSVHVAVEAGADPEMVLWDVTARLQSRFGFASCTVQVEQHREETAACPHCQDPHA
ncbi:zinc transporter 3 [Pitangus sulphuratus]|nr:zinc transporter 3 [Pitangus sulphuratus]